MNSQEAKTILQAYRPNGADAEDPALSEALALVQTDPALRDWFTRQTTFDRAAAKDYEAISAPAGLRESILAAAAASEAPTTHPRFWRRAAVWISLAAAVAVLVTVGISSWPKPKLPAANSSLAEFAISDAQHPKTHGGHGEEAATLNHMLNLPTTHLSDQLPVDFDRLRNSGCRTLHVDGRDVLEVCFKRNGVGLHCYVARREDFPALRAPAQPAVEDKPSASIATWADKSNLYIVVTKPGHEALEKLL